MSNVKEIKIGTTTYDIVGKGVENQRDSSKAKVWVGTNAQYSSLGTLDSDTVYYRTDNGGTVETAATATNATNATNDDSGNNIANTYATKTELNQKSSFKLFHHDWFDYLLNDQDWLRADTFSWQDGNVYTNAYSHLVADLESSKKMFYGWISGNPLDLSNYYTLSATPSVGDAIYSVENNTSADALTTIASISGTTIVGANGISYFSNAPETRELYLLSKDTMGAFDVYYYLASDGHKIVAALNEEDVSDVYDEFGVAWYYVLDTTNQRFKLPRTKYGFVGLRDTVGKYVPESLPNIKGDLDNAVRGHTASGAFYNTNSGKTVSSGASNEGTAFSASLSSSTYQDNAPVQQRATQMYLYFYVGQFAQTATEQTAGLNSELFNGKVDLNAANLSTAGRSLISGLGMPSTTYDTLTAGANGSTYTAPANGWFVFHATVGSGGYLGLRNTTTTVCFEVRYSSPTIGKTFVPARSGDIIEIGYEQMSSPFLGFIYAEGEENV